MRLKLSSVFLITIVFTLYVQEISAGIFCGIITPCTTTEPPASTPSASASSMPSASSIIPPPPTSSIASQPLPSSSSIVPSPKPSSSIAPSPIPTSIVSSIASSTALPSLSSSASSTITSPSTAPSATTSSSESTGGSNIGVIVGSVCGFVAIIGAGFAYAFFSKTRKNNRNKRLYSNTPDDFHGNNSYQPDPYSHNTRPSPALAASAVAAADNIHGHNGHWDNNQGYNYGNMAPQTPMVAVASQQDPYYTTGPAQMGYATDPNMNGYYNNSHQQYYDPNAGYYEQQQHYDQHYVDSQKQYIPQHQSPLMNNSNVNLAPATTVYSAPHSYPDDTPNPPHTPNAVNGNNSTYR